ncbi:uncharacterized protein BXZ73DRAFT_17213, partial [Epithele typhae]|uniref:uncharacterized protein n=1 Tax=Epithele typhae TaxID=378194 RepID=UPI0020084074
QILGVACDNASANIKMLAQIEVELDNFLASVGHVRCFGHVIQLVSFALLKHFN